MHTRLDTLPNSYWYSLRTLLRAYRCDISPVRVHREYAGDNLYIILQLPYNKTLYKSSIVPLYILYNSSIVFNNILIVFNACTRKRGGGPVFRGL